MKDLERELKNLQLRRPSPALRNRLFPAAVPATRRRLIFNRRVSLGWAVAFLLFGGILGFGFARISQPHARVYLNAGTEDGSRARPVRVRVIYDTDASQDLLDFSGESNGFLSGKCDIRVKTKPDGGV